MPAPTTQEINDAKTDLDDLEQIVNGDASTTVTTRLGGNKPSVSKALSDATAFRSVADYTALAALLAAGTVPVGAAITVLSPSGPPFEVKQGVATDDRGVVITENRATTSASGLYAERIFSGPVNLLWYGATNSPNVETGTIIDSDSAFADAVAGAKARLNGIYIPEGDWVFSTEKFLDWDGAFVEGANDFNCNVWYNGSTDDDAWVVGDRKVSVNSTSQVMFRNFRMRLTANAVVNNVFYVSASSFQTYFYRIRYARSFAVPADAVVLLDSNAGTDYAVRTVLRDCYFEGTPYGGYVGAADCGMWAASAIQTIVDNCHFQDFETNLRLGSADPDYIQDQIADFYVVNNSRFQHGDRGQLVGTGEGIEIFGQCNNVNFIDTTIYCNNNAPDPRYGDQIPFRVHGDINGGTIQRVTVNLNSRSDYFMTLESTATVDDLTIDDIEILNPRANEFFNVVSGAVTNGISVGKVRYDNPNADFINTSLTGNTNHTINLDFASIAEINVDSGTTETINAFSGGVLGVPCYLHCNVTSGQLDFNASSSEIYFNSTSAVTIADDSVLEVIPFKFNANKRYRVTLVSRQLTNIADLNQTVSGTYSQSEVQAISDKVDELLVALNSQGYIRSF
jgi:hypothetical protein